MIAAIILAAGKSTRLGRPKQSLILNGETLITRSIRIAQEAGLTPVILIVPATSEFGAQYSARAVIVVPNEHAAQGMATSIIRGIGRAQSLGCSGAVVMTCDQVGATADHLRDLASQQDRMTASGYAGRVGVPAYFPSTSFDALHQLEGDQGARSLLQSAHVLTDEALALDIDTPEDLAKAESLFNR